MKAVVFFVFFSLGSSVLFAQMAPFVDFNNYFRTFYKNAFRQLEFQPVRSFEGSDNLIAYIDFKGDFKIYDGESTQMLSNQLVSYKLGDNLLAWNIGPTLFCLHNGKRELLTTFANRYLVSDSLIVYEDLRFNSIMVRKGNENKMIYQSISEPTMPDKIGDNILVFKDNGDFYKIFWRDSIYDFAVYTKAILFECGRDIVCFNDPINQSFTVFDNGQFLDLESVYAKKYKAGRGFVVYEDIQGNLWYYANGEKEQLSSFGSSDWTVQDDLVIWNENNFIYTLYNGTKTQILNYAPTEFQVKNKSYVFRNFMGGVSVLYEGKVIELTKQMNAKFQIYGNTVLLELFNRSYIVFNEGKTYEP